MNSLKEIKSFWELHDIHRFKPNDIALYFYLLEMYDISDCVPFIALTHQICYDINIQATQLVQSRNRLSDAGLVEVISTRGSKRVEYRIIPSTERKSSAKNSKENKEVHQPITVHGKTWKDDIEMYKEELRDAYRKTISDSEWITKQESFNPGVDIKKTIEKSCINFWSTEAGWKHKKRTKTKEIDWRATFANSISQKANKVYISDYGIDKYEKKRLDSIERKADSYNRIKQLSEEWIKNNQQGKSECEISD